LKLTLSDPDFATNQCYGTASLALAGRSGRAMQRRATEEAARAGSKRDEKNF
jgi:hypothetical protein